MKHGMPDELRGQILVIVAAGMIVSLAIAALASTWASRGCSDAKSKMPRIQLRSPQPALSLSPTLSPAFSI